MTVLCPPIPLFQVFEQIVLSFFWRWWSQSLMNSRKRLDACSNQTRSTFRTRACETSKKTNANSKVSGQFYKGTINYSSRRYISPLKACEPNVPYPDGQDDPSNSTTSWSKSHQEGGILWVGLGLASGHGYSFCTFPSSSPPALALACPASVASICSLLLVAAKRSFLLTSQDSDVHKTVWNTHERRTS